MPDEVGHAETPGIAQSKPARSGHHHVEGCEGKRVTDCYPKVPGRPRYLLV